MGYLDYSDADLEAMSSEPIAMYNSRYDKNPIVTKTWSFALDSLRFADDLESKRKYRLAAQIAGCCTSIGANVREAQNAESLADFIHKMKIASKEADESEYFLSLCEALEYEKAASLRKRAYELVKILNAIIATSKKRLKDKKR